MFRKIWAKLTFDTDRRKTPRVILVVFFVAFGFLTFLIYKNPSDFISIPASGNILNFENISDEALAVINPNATAEEKQSAVEKYKKTSSSQSSSSDSVSSSSNTSNSSSADGDDSVPPESASAFVAFYADNQSDSSEDDSRHSNVVSRILASGANPVLHAGDIMEDGTLDSWNRFLNIAGALLGSRNFYSALGNNDRVVGDSTTPSPYFLNYFNFPNNEQWYSVNSGNLHIVILDSAFSSASATQQSWLASDLQSDASQSRITVVVFHHPTFSSNIESSLQSYGVDFVVAGHIHSYSKTLSAGIYRFTLPGGTSLGHATAEVFSNYAAFKAYDLNGILIETTTINER